MLPRPRIHKTPPPQDVVGFTSTRVITFRSFPGPDQVYAPTAFQAQVGQLATITIDEAKILEANVDPRGRWVDIIIEVPHFDDDEGTGYELHGEFR